jgi:hypothetical protein
MTKYVAAAAIALLLGAMVALRMRHHHEATVAPVVAEDAPRQGRMVSVRDLRPGRMPAVAARIRRDVAQPHDDLSRFALEKYRAFSTSAHLTDEQEQRFLQSLVDARTSIQAVTREEGDRALELMVRKPQTKAEYDAKMKERAESISGRPMMEGFAAVYGDLTAEVGTYLTAEQLKAFEREFNPHFYTAIVSTLPIEDVK